MFIQEILTSVDTMFNIIYFVHLVTAPHDLQVENPFDLPSFAPYVHVLPSVEPHDLHASLYSCPAAGGSPNVGVI